VTVSPLPGPSAVSAIVSVSGFPEKNILFAGFLSKKEGRRKRELLQLKEQRGIIVLFESPHRIKKLLGALLEVFPDSPLIVGREMSKLHEEFLHGSVRELCERADSIIEKGEFTIALYNRADGGDAAGKGDE
jgi:16S rRNA (cytidine1402-2'-O)-methyltransferase